MYGWKCGQLRWWRRRTTVLWENQILLALDNVEGERNSCAFKHSCHVGGWTSDPIEKQCMTHPAECSVGSTEPAQLEQRTHIHAHTHTHTELLSSPSGYKGASTTEPTKPAVASSQIMVDCSWVLSGHRLCCLSPSNPPSWKENKSIVNRLKPDIIHHKSSRGSC